MEQADRQPRVAVIGAGMAGLAAARRLRQAGVACTVFEKSRGVSGRMATRRADGSTFDHGAQYFTVRGPRFAALVRELEAAGAVAQWFEGGFVGQPTMSAVGKALAGSTPVVTERRVTGLNRHPSGWSLRFDSGPSQRPGGDSFDAVVLAVPAPQAGDLLQGAGIGVAGLSEVTYAPCWALMLAFDEPPDLGADRLTCDDGPIAWVAREASKPGRRPDAGTCIVHAAPDWSRVHLEWRAEAVAEALHAAFSARFGVSRQPRFIAAHRWRHARVERPFGAPCHWDRAAGIGLCGDWCIGARVEAAFDSGEAVATALIGSMAPG
ncbi:MULTISPECIES: FAD-dependent oxidoreductase [unclassified Roseitalea]|uniref:NAD(P)/FAD-dependent oxidoreductase n=1 Tax=unclassified Roseitalea TaxID=2639107 RepID=UPI00273FCEAC|nr:MULTISPECIES: FAD-dependent oxidoreductase [unclassified Roseitalea]